MIEDILDSPIKVKPKQRKVELVVPLIILLLFIYSLYTTYTFSYLLRSKDYIAFGLVLIISCIYFIHRYTYIYLLAGILVFGTFNYVSFEPHNISFFIFIIPIQPVSLVLLGLHLLIFKKDFDKNKIKRDSVDSSQEKINSFKSKFKEKSNKELALISSGEGYQKEAMIAAKELLIEKLNSSQH